MLHYNGKLVTSVSYRKGDSSKATLKRRVPKGDNQKGAEWQKRAIIKATILKAMIKRANEILQSKKVTKLNDIDKNDV